RRGQAEVALAQSEGEAVEVLVIAAVRHGAVLGKEEVRAVGLLPYARGGGLQSVAERPAEAHRRGAVAVRAGAGRGAEAVHVVRALGDDVDDGVHGVAAVERG